MVRRRSPLWAYKDHSHPNSRVIIKDQWTHDTLNEEENLEFKDGIGIPCLNLLLDSV